MIGIGICEGFLVELIRAEINFLIPRFSVRNIQIFFFYLIQDEDRFAIIREIH